MEPPGVDPVPVLLSSGNEAIAYFARRDLLGEAVEPVETLWELPAVARILRRQRADGSWKYPGRATDPGCNYALLETFRMLGELVEKYGLDRQHPAIQRAAGYVFGCQTAEGDFRGIYATQYAPTYAPALMELLIKAGYADDPRIERGFGWLLAVRQDDGGWAVPLRTVGIDWREAWQRPDPIQPDRSRPFSHLVTGMVLRAFAAHPAWRTSREARAAGALLASRFFRPDRYVDRQDKSYWEKVSYPFWFTDIVSALDSLSFLGFTANDPPVRAALDWLQARQQPDGLFDLKLLRGKDKSLPFWVCLAVCRVFKRYHNNRR